MPADVLERESRVRNSDPCVIRPLQVSGDLETVVYNDGQGIASRLAVHIVRWCTEAILARNVTEPAFRAC